MSDSNAGAPFRIIEVRNNLKNKATRGEGVSPKQAIEQAESRLMDLAEEYDDRLKNDMEQLRVQSARIGVDPVDDWADIMLRLVHDMEGQAGIFNYEMISFICGSLGRVLKNAPHDHPKFVATIEAHCDAIFLVYNQKIRGDGGNEGRTLLRGLKATADTCVPPVRDRRNPEDRR